MEFFIRPAAPGYPPKEAAIVISVTQYHKDDHEDYTVEAEIPLKDLAAALKPYLTEEDHA